MCHVDRHVVCTRVKLLFTVFKYLFLLQRYSSFKNNRSLAPIFLMAATCFEGQATFGYLVLVFVFLPFFGSNVHTGEIDTCGINSDANLAFFKITCGIRAPQLTNFNRSGTHHFGYSSSTAFSAARIKRYLNSSPTFQLDKIAASGDISPIPGPKKCETCSSAIASSHRALCCASCTNWHHLKCAAVKSAEYGRLVNKQWVFWCVTRAN